MVAKEQPAHPKRACHCPSLQPTASQRLPEGASLQQGAAHVLVPWTRTRQKELVGSVPNRAGKIFCNCQQRQPFTKKYAVLRRQAGEMHITSPKDRRVTCMLRQHQELSEASEVPRSLFFPQLCCLPPCSPVAQRKAWSPKPSWQCDPAHTKPASSRSKQGTIHQGIGDR